jgi:PAS domain S-box-containing protein
VEKKMRKVSKAPRKAQRTIAGIGGSDDLQRIALEGVCDGIVVADGKALLYANPKFLELFGYKNIGEAAGQGKYAWIHPDHQRTISGAEKELKSSGCSSGCYVIEGVKCNGAKISIEAGLSTKSIKRKRYSVFTVREHSNGIDRESELKERLKESEELLIANMEASPVAILWADLAGKVIYINHQFKDFFGYGIEEIPTMDDWRQKAYPIESYREIISPPNLFDAEPGKWPKEAWVSSKNNYTRYMLRGRTIAANRIMITYMDLTEWEDTKIDLVASQTQLSEALYLANAAQWAFDASTLKYNFNDAFYALYGTTAEEQNGYEVSMEDFPIRFIHPDDRAAYYKAVEENNGKENPPEIMQVEERGLRPDGKDMYVHSRMRVYKDVHGRSLKLLGVTQDITPQRQAQADLTSRAQELARSNAELEQFVYVASHDLQEPLRMVASYTELLARRYKEQLDSDADEFIAYAVDGANRMKRLIDDLLSYSRVGTRGKLPQPTNSESAFRHAVANLSLAIEEKKAVVTSGDLPLVLADESQLIQLFQNLIANAIKFQSADLPTVHVSAEAQDHEWIFEVRDNGIGIDPEYFDRIFLIFQRLHKKDEYPGTGIGLAVCKRIVERHGGRIWVESSPGNGSAFYFTFPIKGGKRV